jgi:hypothetical protein
MFKFYVLWSKDIGLLHRATVDLPREKTVVIINTLDDASVNTGVTFCQEYNIEYYVTESDGTPATGKNSLLKKFLESDNEYMVAIDGDDHLTAHGVYLYQELAKHPFAPDIVCLYRQLSESNQMPFDKSQFRLNRNELIWFFMNNKHYRKSQEVATQWATKRIEFDNFMHDHMEDSEFMCRLVFHSRQAASLMKYTNELYVGEDSVQFLKLKKLSVNGEINMLRRREKENPTYIYNDTSESIMREKYKYDWSWAEPLLEIIYKEQDLPKNVSLIEFKDSDWV